MALRSAAGSAFLLLLLGWEIGPGPGTIRISDNRRAAGTERGGALVVRLEARLGVWHPDGDEAPGAVVPAFAEAGHAPQIPGPLIRVRAGTAVTVSVRNAVPGASLIVHGLHGRPLPAAAPDTLVVPPGAAREVRLRLEAPGTYYYWGTTTGRSFPGRTREDAQLSGAVIVDPPVAVTPPDRILIIGMWADTMGTEGVRQRNRLLFVVNGRSWPHTERLSYTVGDTVRLRVLNISADLHPMHLHGFFFRVESRGDGTSDTTYDAADRDLVVTQRLPMGRTMSISWIPDRVGNWLFHCHVPAHFGPRGPLGMRRPEPSGLRAEAGHGAEGMNGLVVGITVHPRPGAQPAPESDAGPRRHLRLLVRENAGSAAANPYYGFALQEEGAEPPPDSGHRPGPPIVLIRGEPVSITVVNRSPEPTAVHWHGIELESYYDGVAGFSGWGGRLAPLIAPGDSFEARFTPPRAGTFIYHTHTDELRQEPAGLAGPIVVLEPGVRYDSATDHTVLISSPSDTAVDARAVLLNGSLMPPPLELRVGAAVRLRFINITVSRPGIRLELLSGTDLASWRLLAKDAADLPPTRRRAVPARQVISIGETVDAEVTPAAPGDLRLEVRTAQNRLLSVLPIRVREGTR